MTSLLLTVDSIIVSLVKRNQNEISKIYLAFTELGLFSLNANIDLDNNNSFSRIRSRYYSPHSFEQMKNSLTKTDIEHTFSAFHNYIRSIRSNLGYFERHLSTEPGFHFDVMGISETKITNSNSDVNIPKIPGYNFEFVLAPLSAGGVGMFIDESLDYKMLEKTSNTEYQALWIVILFSGKKNTVWGIIYKQLARNFAKLF